MMVHYPTFVDQVHQRYPFFRSTFFERRMLFEGCRWQSRSMHELGPSQGNDPPFAELDGTASRVPPLYPLTRAHEGRAATMSAVGQQTDPLEPPGRRCGC
jgi:hypothetical protein